jgi:hypothetical protein
MKDEVLQIFEEVREGTESDQGYAMVARSAAAVTFLTEAGFIELNTAFASADGTCVAARTALDAAFADLVRLVEQLPVAKQNYTVTDAVPLLKPPRSRAPRYPFGELVERLRAAPTREPSFHRATTTSSAKSMLSTLGGAKQRYDAVRIEGKRVRFVAVDVDATDPDGPGIRIYATLSGG